MAIAVAIFAKLLLMYSSYLLWGWKGVLFAFALGGVISFETSCVVLALKRKG